MKSYVLGFALAILVGGLFYVFVLRQSPEQESANLPQAQEQQQIQESPMTNELKIEEIVIGTGTEAKAGNTVLVHYTGTFLNGTKFDSSLDRGVPLQFVLGAGQVIQGWDQGVLGMKVGGKRKLTIPPALASVPVPIAISSIFKSFVIGISCICCCSCA